MTTFNPRNPLLPREPNGSDDPFGLGTPQPTRPTVDIIGPESGINPSFATERIEDLGRRYTGLPGSPFAPQHAKPTAAPQISTTFGLDDPSYDTDRIEDLGGTPPSLPRVDDMLPRRGTINPLVSEPPGGTIAPNWPTLQPEIPVNPTGPRFGTELSGIKSEPLRNMVSPPPQNPVGPAHPLSREGAPTSPVLSPETIAQLPRPANPAKHETDMTQAIKSKFALDQVHTNLVINAVEKRYGLPRDLALEYIENNDVFAKSF
jgi:hypothetical protein